MSDIFDVESWKDASLVSAKVGRKFATVTLESMAGAGGNSGLMTRIIAVEAETGAEMRFVLKTTRPLGSSSSKSLELYREAMFYKRLLHTLGEEAVPQVFLAEWNEETGQKAILMEDLSVKGAVQAGYFYGDNSFLNKGKDLAALTKDFPEVTELAVSKKAFAIAAQLHGSFVGDESLLAPEYAFLKGQHWFKGESSESWYATVGYAKSQWELTKAKLAKGECGIKFNEQITAYLNNSFDATFEEYVAAVKHVPFTLAHGDFHPANFLIIRDAASPDGFALKVLDFEVIGIGSGTQDLGQYMISHSFPHVRRQHEGELLRHYHEVLTAKTRAGASVPSLEEIKREYVLGGLGRWVWLLAVISTLCPEPMTEFFVHQLTEFLNDHQDIHRNERIVPRP